MTKGSILFFGYRQLGSNLDTGWPKQALRVGSNKKGPPVFWKPLEVFLVAGAGFEPATFGL